MKSFIKCFRCGLLILGLLMVLAFAFPALAENVIILTVSEDRLESCVDEKGISLQQTIEAYVRALEVKGDTVRVFGSARGNRQEPFVIYPSENESFDWTQGEGGRNDAYYSRTLAQLEKTDFAYDRIVVITGYLRATQSRSNTRTTHPTNNLIPAIVYSALPLPGSDSALEVYQAASGLKFTSDEEKAVNGFTKHENTLMKAEATFDAARTLDDLLSVTYSGKTAHQGTEVAIPGASASKAVMLVTGSGLEELKLVLNGAEVINTTAEKSEKTESTWYGAILPWGSGEARLFEIPEEVSGSIKISGGSEDTTADLYYLRDDSFSQKLQNAVASKNGLEYAADGTVIITMPDDEVSRELKMLYPSLSFQAQVTLLDSAKSFTLYSEDLQHIRWTDVPNEKAEVTVSICEMKDGTELIPSQKLRYTPLSTVLDLMTAEIALDPAENLVKRQEAVITLKLMLNADTEEEQKRIKDWLAQAEAMILDRNEEQAGLLSFDADNLTFTSSGIKMPATAGTYSWKAQLSSGENFVFKYSKGFETKSVKIENHAPQCNTDLVSEQMTLSMQPGEFVGITIPSGLYTDSDGDQLSLIYTVAFGTEERQTESVVCENGESPEIKISGLNEFGDWSIRLTANDIDDEEASPIEITVHVTDGNTAPYVDPEKRTETETAVPLLSISNYELVIPRGLFVDAEGNNMTVYVNLTDPQQNEEQYTFKGKDGISSVWRHPLEHFGSWGIELFAVDENEAHSEKYAYTLKLVDALEKLPGKLSISPEAPEKGDAVTFTLTLDWPEEYSELPIREWLQNCTATVKDNFGAVYEMKLADNANTFKTDGVIMPTEETELTFSAMVSSNDGNDPQKDFTDYNSISISIKNSAPVAVATPLEDQTQFLFNLSDFEMKIPASAFADAENDDFTVRVELQSGDGVSVPVASIQKGEVWDLIFPSFDSWNIVLTAADTEGSESVPFIYGKVHLHNLKMIILIAGAAVILLVSLLIIIIRIRYKRNLPKFNANDGIVFKTQKESLRIKMPAEETDPIPVATFAVSLPILLSDTQWNNMKQWSVYPTKGDKPALRRSDSKAKEDTFEVDLGEGLSVNTNSI